MTTTTTTAVETSPRARSIAVSGAAAFVAAMTTSIVNVSVPVIARDLKTTPLLASWILSIYFLVVSCLLPLAGRLADMFGRRRVMLGGGLLFVAGSVACAFAPSLGGLLGGRAAQATGAACLMAVGPAIVTSAFPPEQRARGLGLLLAMTYTGLTLGPTLGGVLTARFGWHAIFGAVAVGGVVSMVATGALLARDAPARDATPERPALDLGGAALLALGLGAILVALKRAPTSGWLSTSVVSMFVLAAIAIAVFARHEARQRTPLLPLAMLGTRRFAVGIAGGTLLYTITFVLAYVLPFHLQREHGMSPSRAGLLMTAQPAAMALTAPLSGVIADRRGARLPLALGMLAIASGLLVVSTASSEARIVIGLALVGVGAGLYIAPNNAEIMAASPRGRQSTAAALAATARNVGMTIGIATGASLEPALGFGGALAVAAALAGSGIVFSLVR